MNFDYTDDQRALKDEARKFLTGRCPITVVRGVLEDASRGHDAALWSGIGEMGWLGSVLPEAYGGLGLGHVELCAIAEEIGRSLAPVPFASTLYFFAQALMRAGDDGQRERWLPAIAEGRLIGCFAASEGAGEPLPARPAVRFQGSRLHGTKLPVVDGGIADAAIVLAGEGADGLTPSLFIVDLHDAAVQAASLASLDSTRDLARLSFAGAPAERLGEPGQGLALAQEVYDRAAALLAFEQIGGADRCLELARDHALERHAFGRAIASYQAIKHKLAEVFVRNQLARSNAYHAAWALNHGGSALPLAAGTARLAAGDAYWFAAKESIQTQGGMGFTWEVDAHLFYRRAQQLALAAGGAAYWKDRLVSHLERTVTGQVE